MDVPATEATFLELKNSEKGNSWWAAIQHSLHFSSLLPLSDPIDILHISPPATKGFVKAKCPTVQQKKEDAIHK